jgi:hypothetical protein
MKQARDLAVALLNCSNDVSDRKFTDSQLGTVTVPIGCDPSTGLANHRPAN